MASIFHAYVPGTAFPAISVTGDDCTLMCDHCRGRHLRGMRPSLTPGSLAREVERLVAEGGAGLLLSGGCDGAGRVPLEAFVDTLIDARRRGLLVNIHPGLCDEDRATMLAPACDSVSLDLICDDRAAKEMLHLPSAQGHMATIDSWMGKGPRVVPHLLLGLAPASSESKAISFCRQRSIGRLVLLVLLPPNGNEVIADDRVVRAAKAAMEGIPEVVLGCMRPRGRPALEVACIDAGVRHMANPSLPTLEHARQIGLEVRIHHACCSLP